MTRRSASARIAISLVDSPVSASRSVSPAMSNCRGATVGSEFWLGLWTDLRYRPFCSYCGVAAAGTRAEVQCIELASLRCLFAGERGQVIKALVPRSMECRNEV